MARAQLSPEEQLEDLQRRFQLLEGERKATYETAQLNIRQNKEIVKQMKEENKTKAPRNWLKRFKKLSIRAR